MLPLEAAAVAAPAGFVGNQIFARGLGKCLRRCGGRTCGARFAPGPPGGPHRLTAAVGLPRPSGAPPAGRHTRMSPSPYGVVTDAVAEQPAARATGSDLQIRAVTNSVPSRLDDFR